MRLRRLTIVSLAGLLLVLGACAREWYRVREEETVRVQTELLVFSEPPGADVSVNGSHRGTTPLRVKLIYRYRRVIYARERSYGVIRDQEERMLPEYFNNAFEIQVSKPGYEAAKLRLDLRGEETKEVHAPLVLER